MLEDNLAIADPQRRFPHFSSAGVSFGKLSGAYMPSLPDDLDSFLATTTEMLSADGAFDAANFLRSAQAQIEQTGYDNWNGGTTIWTLFLRVPARDFAQLGSKREVLEGQIDGRLAVGAAVVFIDFVTETYRQRTLQAGI